MEKFFRIEGLDCANCAAKIERAVSKLDKVDKVTINFMTGKMLLAADEQSFEEVYADAVKTIKKYEPSASVRRA
ncbi:MAG: heavy metal transporter [Clostridia bacterium]|nr:heavy metal transporter [Clostridia bacterium]